MFLLFWSFHRQHMGQTDDQHSVTVTSQLQVSSSDRVSCIPTQCRTAVWTPAGRAMTRWVSADSASQGPCTEARYLIGPAADQSLHWRQARTQQVRPEGRSRTWEPPEDMRDRNQPQRVISVLLVFVSVTVQVQTELLALLLWCLLEARTLNFEHQHENHRVRINLISTVSNIISPPGWGKHCPACFQKLLRTWWSPLRSSEERQRKTTLNKQTTTYRASLTFPLIIHPYRTEQSITMCVCVCVCVVFVTCLGPFLAQTLMVWSTDGHDQGWFITDHWEFSWSCDLSVDLTWASNRGCVV